MKAQQSQFIYQSPTAPVYRHTSAASPALDKSASVAFSYRKTSACIMKCLSERICFRASPFPMPNTRKVVSQPRMARANNILLQTSRPSTLWTYLMFQHRGLIFVPGLTSGMKKTSQESSLTWKHRSTSRSVSSPARVVSQIVQLYLYQDICIPHGMTCFASNVFQALT